MAIGRFTDELVHDLRIGYRQLLRWPAWSIACVATLALGIGLNAAVFSAINALLLRPVPYPAPGRIALVTERVRLGGTAGEELTLAPQPAVFEVWRQGTRSFERLEAVIAKAVTWTEDDGTESSLRAAVVSPGFFSFAGQHPIIGRSFQESDTSSGAPVVLISEGMWRTRFGANPAVVDTAMRIDDALYHIIGVMPAGLKLPFVMQAQTDLWLPLQLRSSIIGVSVIGRLARQASHETAAGELTEILRASNVVPDSRRAAVTPIGDLVSYKGSLEFLAISVLFVLLITWANISHLLLARGSDRQGEFAVRAALGADRFRLVKQLVTETLLLVFAGLAAALAVGWTAIRAIVAFSPAATAQLATIRMDGRTVAVACSGAIAASVVFGLVAVWQASRVSLSAAMRDGGRGASTSRARSGTRSVLVVSEMALSMVLLICATLLIRTVVRLQSSDPGFRPAGLYTVRVKFPRGAYRTDAARLALLRTLADQLRGLAGVRAVTLIGSPIPGSEHRLGALQIDGAPPPDASAAAVINIRRVAPDFFAIAGLHFEQGGAFTDTSEAASQVIINASLAEKYWSNGSAVGRRIRVVYASTGEWRTIVGVVKDAALNGLAVDRNSPLLYSPGPQPYAAMLLVRASETGRVLPALHAALSAADRSLPPAEVAAVSDALAATADTHRFTMVLLLVFAGVALVLATVGLYGVMAYSVAQRTKEIGIRIALGASSVDIGRTAVARGMALCFIGLLAGTVAAHWAGMLLASRMSGVASNDTTTAVIAGAVLLTAAMVACLVPTRKALSVDPVIALRAD